MKTATAEKKPENIKVYCPRCDKEFSAFRKREAVALLDAHLKKNHPDYQNEEN